MADRRAQNRALASLVVDERPDWNPQAVLAAIQRLDHMPLFLVMQRCAHAIGAGPDAQPTHIDRPPSSLPPGSGYQRENVRRAPNPSTWAQQARAQINRKDTP